MTQKHDSLSWN